MPRLQVHTRWASPLLHKAPCHTIPISLHLLHQATPLLEPTLHDPQSTLFNPPFQRYLLINRILSILRRPCFPTSPTNQEDEVAIREWDALHVPCAVSDVAGAEEEEVRFALL